MGVNLGGQCLIAGCTCWYGLIVASTMDNNGQINADQWWSMSIGWSPTFTKNWFVKFDYIVMFRRTINRVNKNSSITNHHVGIAVSQGEPWPSNPISTSSCSRCQGPLSTDLTMPGIAPTISHCYCLFLYMLTVFIHWLSSVFVKPSEIKPIFGLNYACHCLFILRFWDIWPIVTSCHTVSWLNQTAMPIV